MKILKYIGIGLVALIVIFLLLGVVAPKDLKVERSIVINAPKDVVMPNVISLKKRQVWSPWADLDPDMKVVYEGTEGAVGSRYFWKGNDEVGEGNQDITSITANRVEGNVNFIKPFESSSAYYVQMDEQGAGVTKVAWGFKGTNPFPFNAVCLFIDMDGMLGKDFDKGLIRLKAICEKK
jgi:hypothetical protein